MKNSILKEGIYTAYLYPTLNCNLNCKMCYSGGNKNQLNSINGELSKEQYFKLIDNLYRAGIRNFDISGGEPLIREDIDSLIDHIKSYEDTKIYMVSNGTLIKNLSPEKLEAIKKSDQFYVSIDSPIPEEHNAIRNVENAFQRTIEGLKILTVNDFKNLGVNFVLMNSNKESVVQLLEFCYDNQIKHINLLRFIDNSSDLNLKGENLSNAFYVRIYSYVKKWILEKESPLNSQDMEITFVLPGFMMKKMMNMKIRSEKNRIKLRLEYDPLRGCKAFQHSIVISSIGDVTGCTGMIGNKSFHAGNIAMTDFNEIVDEFKQLRETIILERERKLLSDGACETCEEWHICRGGCPIVAQKYNGDIFTKDPSCKWEV